MRSGLVMRASQRGLSVVEMMVGIAIGLVIVAAATLMVAGQLADNRRLLLETQVQQDLRAAADLVTRGLRRAGYWKDSYRSTSAAAVLQARLANPYAAITPGTDAQTVSAVTFSVADKNRAENNAVDDDERLGFRLSGGAIETQLGNGNWQPLTDPNVLRVTGFTVRSRVNDVALQCWLDCSGTGTLPCPPVQRVRSFVITISGEAVHDSRVQRSVTTQVRARNDAIDGDCFGQ